MEVFVQQLINGITLGSIYGLIAIGYTMVFGIIGMVNFAHGDVFMVSAFIALIALLLLTTWLGIGSFVIALFIVLVVAMFFTSLLNWAIERVAYRPLRGSFRLAPLISAIGMSIFLSNFVQVAQGPRVKSIPPFFNEVIVLTSASSGYEVAVSYKQIVVWAVTAALLFVFWFLVSKTALGRAQRACEQDQKMAALLGIDVDRTISITFVIAAALAAVAGTMYLMYYGVVSFADGFVPGVKAFTAAVLGGIGSLPGAVIGGLLIGLIETMWSAYFSTDYKDVAAFSILAITMIFLPQGILGRPDVEKVCDGARGVTVRLARRRGSRAAPGRDHRSHRIGPVAAADRLQHRPEHPQRAHPGDALAVARGPGRNHRRRSLPPRAADRSLARTPRAPAAARARSPRAARALARSVYARFRDRLSAARALDHGHSGRGEMDRQFRRPNSDLRDARLGPQHRGRPRRLARPRLCRLLRRRRLFLCAVRKRLRPVILDPASNRGLPRRVLGHLAGLFRAAVARRLSRHRDARLRRDHPAHPDQLGTRDQRLCRHQRHPAADFLRHSVQCLGRRLCRTLRARVQPDLPHHLPLLSDPRACSDHRRHDGTAATAADRAGMGSLARGRDRLPFARHQYHQYQAHRLCHGRDVRGLCRIIFRGAAGIHFAGELHLHGIGGDRRHRRARRHGQPDRGGDRGRHHDRRHRDHA